MMRQAGDDRHGLRMRALIAVLWRGGLRISEALALNETDIDARRGSLLIRHGKGDKRREAGMDQFGFEQLDAWLAHRALLPPGPLFCVIDGPTRGRALGSDRRPRRAASARRSRRACAGGSRPINCATRTRSSLRVRALRSTSSSASSGIMRVIVSSEPSAIGVAGPAFQAARRRPPGVLATPVWMNAA